MKLMLMIFFKKFFCGTIRKILHCNFNFWMPVVRCSCTCFLRTSPVATSNDSKLLTFFAKKAPWKLLDWVLNMPLHMIQALMERIFWIDFIWLKPTLHEIGTSTKFLHGFLFLDRKLRQILCRVVFAYYS